MNNKLRIAIPVLEGGYQSYRDALNECGAQPVFIKEIYDPKNFEGLLIPGGADLDPALYGEEDQACVGVNRELDDFQIDMVRRFVREEKPILGICRGLQLINVALGGSLYQDIINRNIHTQAVQNVDKVHSIRCTKESFLSGIYGEEFFVNSSHHQAIRNVAEGFEVIAEAEDGIIEAMHHRFLPIYLVQFHPERMSFAYKRSDTVDGGPIIRFFLKRCSDLSL